MFICEVYKSVQGEGRLTGTESVFVRTSGCNLRCWFCDTPYTSWEPEGRQWNLTELVDAVLDYQCRHVVITGGEPMLSRDLPSLTRSLAERELHLTIETAGTVWRPVECDLMSISPKLANSTPTAEWAGEWSARHEATRYQPQVITRLIGQYDYQLKFVVDEPADVDEVVGYLSAFPQVESSRVMLMPQGTDVNELQTKLEWIESLCHQHGFSPCPRKHIEWFGCSRGT